MVLEGLRAYLELASGLTEASRQRAKEVAQLVVSGGLDQTIGPLGKQAQQIAEDLMATSRANRQLLMTLIRAEVDRGIAALGLPTREELGTLQRRVTRLEQAVAAEGSPARKAAATTPTTAPATVNATSGTPQPTTKKTTTRRTTKKTTKKPAVRASTATTTAQTGASSAESPTPRPGTSDATGSSA
jgi:polyhydroxyalkanoate synthesis regulator phasin